MHRRLQWSKPLTLLRQERSQDGGNDGVPATDLFANVSSGLRTMPLCILHFAEDPALRNQRGLHLFYSFEAVKLFSERVALVVAKTPRSWYRSRLSPLSRPHAKRCTHRTPRATRTPWPVGSAKVPCGIILIFSIVPRKPRLLRRSQSGATETSPPVHPGQW